MARKPTTKPTKADLERSLPGTRMTRAVTAEQIMAGVRERGPLRRMSAVRSIDEEARTVEVAFSSETPVDRWFGSEVLDHGPGAVDLARLEDGGAVLVNHDSRQHVGVVDSVRIDSDRVGRAVLRFGRSAAADEVWRDIVDGIRRHVSVGYSIEEVRVEEKKNQPDLVTLTRWTPHEISIVAVPADPSVGVGRSAETPEGAPRVPGQSASHAIGGPVPASSSEGSRSMWETITENGKKVRVRKDDAGNIVERQEVHEGPSPADVQREQERGATAERERVASLMSLARQYDGMEIVDEFIEGNRSREEFQTALLGRLAQSNGGQSRELSERDSGDQRVGMSDQDVRRYSFIRAIRAVTDPTNRAAQEAAAFEFECSEAARALMGREAQGLVVPVDVLTRALNSTTTGTNPGDTGGHLIDETLLTSSFIDLLRNRSVFMRRARPLGGLVGNLAIPKKTATTSGYWIGEDTDAPEDNVDFGQITMAPKTCAALSEITRRALMQTSMDVEAMVRADLAEGLAQTIDAAGWYGAGNGTVPLGIDNLPGVTVQPFAGDYPTYAEVVAMETEVAVANADVAGMAYVMGARMRGALKGTPKFAGTGMPVWEQGNTVNGYAAEVTNAVAQSDMFHGNFADALFGMWGGLELNADPYTHSAKARLRLVAMQDVDTQFRRAASFVVGRKPAV